MIQTRRKKRALHRFYQWWPFLSFADRPYGLRSWQKHNKLRSKVFAFLGDVFPVMFFANHIGGQSICQTWAPPPPTWSITRVPRGQDKNVKILVDLTFHHKQSIHVWTKIVHFWGKRGCSQKKFGIKIGVQLHLETVKVCWGHLKSLQLPRSPKAPKHPPPPQVSSLLKVLNPLVCSRVKCYSSEIPRLTAINHLAFQNH